MRLNGKIALSLVVPMLVMVAVFAWGIRSQILSRFLRLEAQQQTQNHGRLLEAINAELESLETLTRDWGLYDESYTFMRGENPEYIEANYTESTFENLKLDGIVLLDGQFHIREQFGFNKKSQKFEPLNAGLLGRIASSVKTRTNPEIFRGILQFEGRVAQLAISPIQDSDAVQPSEGFLLMFRYLDQGAVDALAARIKLSLRFMPLQGPGSDALPKDALAQLAQQPFWLRIDDEQTVSSFSMLDDLSGNPGLMMQVTTHRAIYQEGLATANQLILFTFAALVLFGLGTFFTIKMVALNRLTRLSRNLIAIGENRSRNRLSERGDDEISGVAQSVNAMLDKLEHANEQRRLASERQRELNDLLVNIATDQSVARGDAAVLYQVLNGSLVAGAALDRWSLWLACEESQRLQCLRVSQASEPLGITPEQLDELLTQANATSALFITCEFANGPSHHAVIVPFTVDERRGALCVETDHADALNQTDEMNFLIAATRLIEHSLHTHYQNLREHSLRRRAEIDPLTNLANRASFEAGLKLALDRMAKNDRIVGLMFIDLDRFKPINDTYGHAVGDWLLCQVAARLRDRVRADDIVARLGGDEFTIVLTALRAPSDAIRIAEKISEALNQPFLHDSGLLQSGASIGIAWAPEHGVSSAELVNAADHAMYAAKQAGRGRWMTAIKPASAPPASE